MHKSTQNVGERLIAGSNSCLNPTSTSVLDTFSLSAPSKGAEAAKKKLQKRAQSKYVTDVVAFPLMQLNSPLHHQYKRSTNCAAEITETPGKYTSKYCNCRWCLVCSKIRTGRLFVGYMPPIEAMAEKWFLTLSRPNVVASLLADEIQYYLRTATLIQRNLREKLKLEYSSLRKIECTYNEIVNTYHPHFHFIFDSQVAAQAFLDEWLSRNPTAKLDKGNQLKKANDKSVIELFKYFTKVVSKSRSKVNGVDTTDYRIHLQALDTMFQAMHRVRTFQPCGVIKVVSEDVEPEQSVDSGKAEVNHYKWLKHDWINVETQAALTGFVPSENQQAIDKHIVYPIGVRTIAPSVATPYFVDKETGEVVPNELVDLRVMRNSMQYAKIYPAAAEDTAPRRGQCRLEPVKCPVLFLIWKDIPEEPAQPVPVALPMVTELVLFPHPIARPRVSTSAKKLPVVRKKPVRAPGLLTGQEPEYFSVLASTSSLFTT
jgi:hypothetical protein